MFTAKTLFKRQYFQAKILSDNMSSDDLNFYAYEGHNSALPYDDYTVRIMRKVLKYRDLQDAKTTSNINALMQKLVDAMG